MSKTILIIEDDASQRRMLQAQLQKHGYEIYTAADGKQGLDQATTLKPDLIILDVILPELNGSVLCGILKYDEEFASIPIILLTVKDKEKDKLIGELVKADAYITKPFEFEHLYFEIRRLLKE